jgi:hypothetical protein
VPTLSSTLTQSELAVLRAAKQKNRRITIEDLLAGRPKP